MLGGTLSVGEAAKAECGAKEAAKTRGRSTERCMENGVSSFSIRKMN